MAKRRLSCRTLGKYRQTAFVKLLVTRAPVVTWWNSIPPIGRTFMLIMITIAVFAAIGMIIMLSIYIKRERASAWRHAMAGWQNNAQADAIDNDTRLLPCQMLNWNNLQHKFIRKWGTALNVLAKQVITV